jgi:hypothetical protein
LIAGPPLQISATVILGEPASLVIGYNGDVLVASSKLQVVRSFVHRLALLPVVVPWRPLHAAAFQPSGTEEYFVMFSDDALHLTTLSNV